MPSMRSCSSAAGIARAIRSPLRCLRLIDNEQPDFVWRGISLTGTVAAAVGLLVGQRFGFGAFWFATDRQISGANPGGGSHHCAADYRGWRVRGLAHRRTQDEWPHR